MALPGNQPGNYVPPTVNSIPQYAPGPLLQANALPYQTGAGTNDPIAQTLTWQGSPAILIRGPGYRNRYRIVLAANGVDLLEANTLAAAQSQATRLLYELFSSTLLRTDGRRVMTDTLGNILRRP